jgi:hypothetical protein
MAGERLVLLLFDRNYMLLETMNYLEKAGARKRPIIKYGETVVL